MLELLASHCSLQPRPYSLFGVVKQAKPSLEVFSIRDKGVGSMSKGFRVDDVVKVVKEGSSFWGREATVRMREGAPYDVFKYYISSITIIQLIHGYCLVRYIFRTYFFSIVLVLYFEFEFAP